MPSAACESLSWLLIWLSPDIHSFELGRILPRMWASKVARPTSCQPERQREWYYWRKRGGTVLTGSHALDSDPIYDGPSQCISTRN